MPRKIFSPKSTNLDGRSPSTCTPLKDKAFWFRGHSGCFHKTAASDGIRIGPVSKVPTLAGGHAKAVAAPVAALLVGQAGVEDVDGQAIHFLNASTHPGLLQTQRHQQQKV